MKKFAALLKATALLVIVVLLRTPVIAQGKEVDFSALVWKVKAQADVPAVDKIGSVGYDAGSWVTGIVPGTVFAAYVAAGLEKDPNFGDNIYKVDKAKYDRNFWYRTIFRVPADFTRNKIWLDFKGINRKAEIYLNGVKIGALDGFMQRGAFDITGEVKRNAENVLTVLVYWPKTPLANYSSPTYLSSAGWDWMPYVPGLNMGITDKVSLSNTGDLTIHDPWVQAKLPTNARADLSINVEVQNNSAGSREGTIKGVITPGNLVFSKKVSFNAEGKTTIRLDKRDCPQLTINSPALWWPNGYGEAHLYTCKLSLLVGDSVSDEQKVSFGIKRYDYDTIGNVLHIAING